MLNIRCTVLGSMQLVHRCYPASRTGHAVLAVTNKAALETLVRVPSSPRVSYQCYEATYLQDAYRTVL
jgi:hypothetical protein